MNIKKLLGQRIKELRKRKNLTQEQVAEYIGIDPASLSNIENGKYYPTSENLEKILAIFNISPHDLFKIEQYQDNTDLHSEIDTILNSHPERMRDFYNIARALVE